MCQAPDVVFLPNFDQRSRQCRQNHHSQEAKWRGHIWNQPNIGFQYQDLCAWKVSQDHRVFRLDADFIALPSYTLNICKWIPYYAPPPQRSDRSSLKGTSAAKELFDPIGETILNKRML